MADDYRELRRKDYTHYSILQQGMSKNDNTEQNIDAYIGIGSNLEDPVSQVSLAIEELRVLRDSSLISCSSLYRSPPMGPADQPDYINAVVWLQTRLAPSTLLEALWDIERRHDRVRGGQRWGPRTLDLDILLYGVQKIVESRLTIPHPGLSERAFVLYPLQEINPDLHIPEHGTIDALINACPPGGLTRLN